MYTLISGNVCMYVCMCMFYVNMILEQQIYVCMYVCILK